jgi:hypothetical protein
MRSDERGEGVLGVEEESEKDAGDKSAYEDE